MAGWDITRSIVAAIEGQVRWVGDFELVFLAQVLRVDSAALLPKRVNWSELKQPAKELKPVNMRPVWDMANPVYCMAH